MSLRPRRLVTSLQFVELRNHYTVSVKYPTHLFLSPRQQNHPTVSVKYNVYLPCLPRFLPFFLQGSKTTAVSVKYIYNSHTHLPGPHFLIFFPKAARSPHSVMVKQILPHAFSMQSLHIVHNFHPQPFMAVKTNKNPFMPCFVSGKITTQRDDETELFSPWTYKSIIFTPRLLHNIHPAFCGWQKQTTFMPCFVGGRITSVMMMMSRFMSSDVG